MSNEISKETISTKVDLGDDLLEVTAPALISSPPASPLADSPTTLEAVDDQLESARILINEGLVEEAKRVLRKVLVSDSQNSLARKKLEEIHELELKQIFGDSGTRGIYRKPLSAILAVDTDQILRDLDRDLSLGLVAESSRDGIEQFTLNVEQEFSDMSARDRLDVGIAFMEMGVFELAVRQFKAAARDADYLVPANALLAHALISWGQPFEAALGLEPLIRDTEIAHEAKLDLLYLMGRAHQALGKNDSAFNWYQQVLKIDPAYRDVPERLRVLKKSIR